MFGVNKAGVDSHRSFCHKQALGFPLLSDPDYEVTKAYGAKGLIGTKRTVVGIGTDGTIVFYRRGMPSDEDILAAMG